MALEIRWAENFPDVTSFLEIPQAISAYRKTGQAPYQDIPANYDPAFNPVHRHLRTAYFTAFRGRAPVGRIAAIRDFLNPTGDTGFFGCFECEDDPGAASALIGAARRWLRDSGCPRMIGPATFNTNQQVGALIEGYEHGPVLMLPYNPPYYGGLMEKSGLVKITDLVTYTWRREKGIPPAVSLAAARARERCGALVKNLALVNIQEESRLIMDLFNSTMRENWGFIPMTIEESASVLHYCRVCSNPDLLLTAWVGEKPVGMLLFLPATLPGPVPPRLLRVAIMGVVPEYRRRGLDAYLIEHGMYAMGQNGFDQADISMIHEDNRVMINIINKIAGTEITRRYRVYGTD